MAFLLSVFPLFFSFPYSILFRIKLPTSPRATRRLVCFYFFWTKKKKKQSRQTREIRCGCVPVVFLHICFFDWCHFLYVSHIRAYMCRVVLTVHRRCMFALLMWCGWTNVCICEKLHLHGRLSHPQPPHPTHTCRSPAWHRSRSMRLNVI